MLLGRTRPAEQTQLRCLRPASPANARAEVHPERLHHHSCNEKHKHIIFDEMNTNPTLDCWHTHAQSPVETPVFKIDAAGTIWPALQRSQYLKCNAFVTMTYCNGRAPARSAHAARLRRASEQCSARLAQHAVRGSAKLNPTTRRLRESSRDKHTEAMLLAPAARSCAAMLRSER